MVSRQFLFYHVDCPQLSAALLACVLANPCAPTMGQAQAPAPITGAGLNTTVTKSGNVYDITGGTRPGNGSNLFHSFGEFGVPGNHVANFLNDSGLATSNILSRVSGGNPSNIFGTIQTTGFGNANLFLMNPAGIVFGPNASLNVGGSVSFTTADYLRLADGARFTAVPGPQDAAISSAPVAAFGFLGSNPAAITVQGGQLAVAEGRGLSLVGGNIDITAGTLPVGIVQSARLSAPAGQVTLASVASAGEVATSGLVGPSAIPALSGLPSLGTISLSHGAVIDTSGDTAGRIVIRSGQFSMEDARLTAHSTSTALSAPSSPPEGGISIQAHDVSLSRGSRVLTSTINGTAGDINFETGTLRSNVGPDGIPLQGVEGVTISSVSTGQGGPGIISVKGQEGLSADAVLLSNTTVMTNVTSAVNHFIPLPPRVGAHNSEPSPPPAQIEITAEHVELTNGTVLQSTTTGGADAGSITLNVMTLKTESGPDGRVLLSSSSNCGAGCFGGQAGDITIQGIPGVTPTSTHNYVFIGTPTGQPTEHITYSLARNIDLQGTDIRSEAIGNAPGGQVLMRAEGLVSMKETSVSVATQNFDITDPALTPSGQLARNQGFSRIDVLAHDVFLKNSTIKADAQVSEPGSCPTCTGGPSAGEIWFRVENSFTADNSSILNTGYGRAQSGITKIIKDNYFSFGAIWEPDFPDIPTNSVKLTNSVITVEARDVGLPGILRIRAHDIQLNHSILDSRVNNVTNQRTPEGQFIDVVGGGERGRTIANGREVQGSVLLSAENIDITGGGIIATTQGERIASRIEIHAGELTTRPGTRPGGTLDGPRILDPVDPARVVISSSSTGIGGAGLVSITGVSIPQPEGTPFPSASSIRLTGTNVLTDTRSDALGGKIEVKANGPVELHGTTISANVNDLRPQSPDRLEQSGNIEMSMGSFSMQGGRISALSTGSQVGGNVVLAAQGPVTLGDGATISASNIGSANAGNVTINAGSGVFSQNASVTTESIHASGGNILIQATDSIRLVNSRISTSVLGGPNSSGGNIVLDPAVVTLQNSQVLAQAVQGTGGNIRIVAGTFLADQTSAVSASSEFGLNGTVSIQSPVSSLSGTLATLPQRPLSAQPLFTQRCAAQAVGQLSSLIVAGQDRLPLEPGGWLMSPPTSMATDVPVEDLPPVTGFFSEPERGERLSGLLSQRGTYDRGTHCGS